MSVPRIVAWVSDSRRAALVSLLAQRNAPLSGVVFARDGTDAARSVTSESFLLIEASRLAELGGLGRNLVGEPAPRADYGAEVETWLTKLPPRTQQAVRDALSVPRAWSVKRLAYEARVSTRQLVRQFHAAGCPVQPKDILSAARLTTAQALLRGGRRPTVRELAHASGWVDARSFRAALRRAALPSVAALEQLAHGRASLSDVVARIHAKRA